MTKNTWPAGVQVLERGWLSSNNILLIGPDGSALIDSGYWTHSAQTVELVRQGLRGESLDLLVNTHLHSDHCGGNAALAEAFPALDIRIPAAEESAVRDWDEDLLSFKATGQGCPRFAHRSTFKAGEQLQLASFKWEVHAAPGHDSNALLLFEPASGTLISADALWENGFGVVFPELVGEPSFDDVARTLDLIEALSPSMVIPGHGRPFEEVLPALKAARRRLERFASQPARHAMHALKVLMKFKLMELGSTTRCGFSSWFEQVPLVKAIVARYFSSLTAAQIATEVLDTLLVNGHAESVSDNVLNVN